MKQYEDYQSVDTKWTKSIPVHWEIKRLKLIFQIRKEKNDPVITNNILSLTAKQGVVPYAEKEGTGGNKPKEKLTDYFIAHEGDLLVNCMNIVSGAVGVSKYFGAVSPVYYPLYPRYNENIWYYHYLFRLVTFQKSLVGLGKGILMHESDSGTLTTVRKRISMDSLGNVLLPVPPREEQDKIVRYLDWKVSKINKLIEIKHHQIARINEHLRYAINKAVTHGIFNSELKDSGVFWMGKIPQNWFPIKIKWLFNEANERNIDGTAELLTFSRKKGLIPFSEATDKAPSANDLTKYRLVSPGQLLENRMQAWTGMFICVTTNGCVSPDYSVFNPSQDRYVNVKFYEYVFRNPLQIEQFANASRGVGTGFNRLYTPAFGSIYTVYPPKVEQDAIVVYLDKLKATYQTAIDKIEAEIETLRELKNKLISDVVTGQLDVRGIEIPEFEYVEETADSAEDEESSEEVESDE